MAREQEPLAARALRRLAGVLAVAACVGVAAPAAWAVDRPSEAEMFGAPAPADAGTAPDAMAPTPAPATATEHDAAPGTSVPAPAAAPAPATDDGARESARDQALLGNAGAGPRLSANAAPEDPLKIGGRLYLRAAYNNPGTVFDRSTGVTVQKTVTFSAPSLVDAYFDARPNDRVRGFVLGRLFFDPTLPSAVATPASTTAMGGTGSSNGNMVNPSVPLLSGLSSTRGPTTQLDQLWLRFDILQTVFVTAGRQHVRWGTGRVWAPTDFLHPERRNPVAAFDARPGFTMLKLHFPWESRGWNFYAVGLIEGVRSYDPVARGYVVGTDSTPTLDRIGGAGRAEFVLGPAELGLDTVLYRGRKPRYGADLSFGVWDLDFYVDAGFQYGSELPRTDANYNIFYSTGIKPQVVAGGAYSLKYNDDDVFTLAGEYFYNARGYSDPNLYLALLGTGLFDFFYLGKHYAAITAALPAPWTWNYTTFSFATIGNLSDQSFLSRLDYSFTFLTHLTFEAYGAVNYGRREGEFRLGYRGDITFNNQTISVSKPANAFSLGVGLRVNI